MRVREVLSESTDSGDLASVLEFLRNRAHNKKLKPQTTVTSIINMVRNMGDNKAFTAMNLKQLADNDSTIQNLVKSINDDGTVDLQPFGDELDIDVEEKPKTTTDGPAKDPEKTVKAMAKRAAANRS